MRAPAPVERRDRGPAAREDGAESLGAEPPEYSNPLYWKMVALLQAHCERPDLRQQYSRATSRQHLLLCMKLLKHYPHFSVEEMHRGRFFVTRAEVGRVSSALLWGLSVWGLPATEAGQVAHRVSGVAFLRGFIRDNPWLRVRRPGSLQSLSAAQQGAFVDLLTVRIGHAGEGQLMAALLLTLFTTGFRMADLSYVRCRDVLITADGVLRAALESYMNRRSSGSPGRAIALG